MISIDFDHIHLRLKHEPEKTFVFDAIRKKWLLLSPEEHVRQMLLGYLIETVHYPSSLIAVEKKIVNGLVMKRFDAVVFDRAHKPWMLIECKEPDEAISEKTLFQLLSYHRSIPCSYWLLTNGHQTFCADARDAMNIRWMDSLPAYDL